MSRDPLTLADHQATAADLHIARERLITLVTAERFVAKTSRAGRLALAALSKIDKLRAELDDQVCRQFPDLDRAEWIYYEPAKRRRSRGQA